MEIKMPSPHANEGKYKRKTNQNEKGAWNKVRLLIGIGMGIGKQFGEKIIIFE